jgi:HD-GYP domain-containing protein (c-di-GMP phosphodiesterase class II)
MALFVNLRSVVHVLSDALDLVGINDVHHGKRVGIMAVAMVRKLGWSVEEQERVFDACLVHDIGVSSTDLHRQLVIEFDWAGSAGHAETGAGLLGRFPPLAHLAEPVRYHHTHWTELRDAYARDKQIANLIFLADRIDVLAAVAMLENQLLARVPAIRDTVAANRGEMFDPQLVDVFLDISRRDAFWLDLEPEAVRDYMDEVARRALPVETDLETLRGVSELFSHVVDAKSRFTVEHSAGVARVARHLAERCGLSADDCGKLEIAGYLHDIGKLRVPDAILEKAGPLVETERRTVASHPYDTYRILMRIPGFEDICHWASYHHEIPTGEGYPFGLKSEELPIQARLLRAADIFQAMVQDRPYRGGLSVAEVVGYMKELVEAGKLDQAICALIETDADTLFRLACAAADGAGGATAA